MKSLKYVLLVTALLGGLVVGCKEKGPMEKAGENIDEAAKETGDALKKGADKTEDALKDAGEKAKDAVDK